MTERVVGIDIGTSGIRAVELEGGRRRTSVSRVHAVPLAEGTVRRGEVLDAGAVTEALRVLWDEGRFRTRRVVIGVGGQSIFSRELTVPDLPAPQLRRTLPFQVQDLLPVPVADAVLDFHPIERAEHEGAPVVRGLLVAAVKESVLGRVGAVEAARLTPVAVDLVPFGLDRAVGRPAVGRTAHIDVGAGSTGVLIADDGVARFVRIIPAGGDDVTRALAEQLGLDRADAERLKRRLGLGGGEVAPEDATAMRLVYAAVSELFTGIRNTLHYYASAHEGPAFASVSISGGGSRADGFAAALAQALRTEVIRSDAFAHVALGSSLRDGLSPDDRDAYALALGLALGAAA